MLNSFDGAEALRTKTKITSVISYSSSIITPSLIQTKQIKAGSSFSILTWMQIIGKEDLSTMKHSLNTYFDKRRKYTEGSRLGLIPKYNQSNMYCYDIHDGKMIYLLLQHLQWNRKYHPYAFCTCKKGSGVVQNDDEECVMWTDEKYRSAWER